jgi:hypothetical protein
MVDCRFTPVDHFSVLDFANLIFVYACSWSFHGAPFIKTLIAKSGRFIPVWNAGPASYVDQNAAARDVLEAEWARQNEEGYAKWDPGPSGPADFTNLCQALEITRHKKGVFLEVGCYRGSSGSIALRYMNQAGIYRDAYFFDVFEGFLYDAALASADAVWSGSHATEGIAATTSSNRKSPPTFRTSPLPTSMLICTKQCSPRFTKRRRALRPEASLSWKIPATPRISSARAWRWTNSWRPAPRPASCRFTWSPDKPSWLIRIPGKCKRLAAQRQAPNGGPSGAPPPLS